MGSKLSLISVLLLLAQPAYAATVTGKTVFRGMGVEEVRLIATVDGVEVARTRSGYHGSFRLALPEGVYELHGSTVLESARGEVAVSGSIPDLRVGNGRIDRLVLELAPDR